MTQSAIEVGKLLVALVQAVAWPALVALLLFRFGKQLERLIDRMAKLKAGEVEATFLEKPLVEAAAALGMAGAKSGVGSSDVANAITAAAQASRDADPGAPAKRQPLEGKRGLWVDDRGPASNSHERRALEALGLTFTLVRSTDEALEAVRSSRFDVIVSDMNRPPDAQAGFTLLAALGREGVRTPFIIYTGARAPELASEAAKRGALGITARPDDLFRLVVGAAAGRALS